MLSELWSHENLAAVLQTKEQFRPFPSVDDRKSWCTIPDHIKQMWMKEGEKLIGFEWPVLLASNYLEFSRTGSRHYDSLYQLRRSALGCLVISECIEGEGRFLKDIVNGIWMICEETTWCLPAHLYVSRSNDALANPGEPPIDLFAADTASLLAWTYYLLKEFLDKVSPKICIRIQQEVKKRIVSPYMERADFWWMGFGEEHVNNWNPWCNSNCLAAVLLLEEDGGRRTNLIHKIIRSIDRYIDYQYSDGGCDEGATYWGVAAGSLFECLELLYIASNGLINAFDQQIIQRMGQYITKMFIHETNYVNFADGSAEPRVDYTLLYRYGNRIGDSALTALGLYGHRTKNVNFNIRNIFFISRELAGIFVADDMEKGEKPQSPYQRDGWLDQIQVMTAREQSDSPEGLYLAIKGGHNNESHNHNDIGQFVVYSDGYPFLIDIGVENYSAQTFGPGRYEIWTMQSRYHNLPCINDYSQKEGELFKAKEVIYQANDNQAHISMDIAGAYPVEAGITYWQRSLTLHRHHDAYIELAEECRFAEIPSSVVINMITCCLPQITANGFLILTDKSERKLEIEFDASAFLPSIEPISIQDSRLQEVWGEQLFRIRFTLNRNAIDAAWKFKIRKRG